VKKDFHQIALQSILFKGRSDWYFCYLKSEKIAHVLVMLQEKSDSPTDNDFKEVADLAATLPSVIVHFAAGEVEAAMVLADIFTLLSSLRILGTRGILGKETALILIQEYENITLKIAAEHHPSPFISADDFTVPEVGYMQERISALSTPFAALSGVVSPVKDGNKGRSDIKDTKAEGPQNTPSDRMSLILEVVRKHNGVSIKDIAAVVRNCSAKTIQRELGTLIDRGLVRREGERRWSLYFATLPATPSID